MPNIRRMKLCINRCPVHSAYWSISVDDDSGGTRLTSGKCCGRWEQVKAWALSSREWRELINEATEALAQAERVEESEVVGR